MTSREKTLFGQVVTYARPRAQAYNTYNISLVVLYIVHTYVRLSDLNCTHDAAPAGDILRAGTVKADEHLRANG